MPARPVLRYHGGKFGTNGHVADWIGRHLPPHRLYVEPFGGAGSVLMRKARAAGEVYNDLDDDIVNLFRVLRTPYQAAELERLLRLTPYARTEFVEARDSVSDPVERARRLIVCSFQGHGSAGLRAESRTGFRAAESEGRILASSDWASFPAHLASFTRRLAGVTIECRPWQDLVCRYEGADTLFYVDPPYLHDVRTARSSDGYRHEMTDSDHVELARWATSSPSMVVVSHYDHPLYREAYDGWARHRKRVPVDSGASRVEILWCNAAAEAARPRRSLFDPPPGLPSPEVKV